MGLYLSRLLQVALTTTLGVGGGVALLFFIFIVVIKGEHNAMVAALKGGLGIGLICAFLIIFVMVLLDLTARLFIAKGVSNNFWDLEQKRELILEGSLKQIVAACRQALLAVPNLSSISEDQEHLSLHALTGASWRSAGEEMEVDIKAGEEGRCQVVCVSRPKSSKVIFDYGKNFENVETWRGEIDRQLPSFAKPV